MSAGEDTILSEIKLNSFDDLRRAVRSARKEQGLRQDDLAETVGLERKTIVGLEGRSEPRFENLLRVSRHLGFELVLRPIAGSPDLEDSDIEGEYGFGNGTKPTGSVP